MLTRLLLVLVARRRCCEVYLLATAEGASHVVVPVADDVGRRLSTALLRLSVLRGL